MHAQWADDVHHGLHVLLTGENQGYYADFAAPEALSKVLQSVFLHDGTYSTFRRRTHGRPVDRTRTPGWRFVASLQTHDQVGNRALGDRLSSQLSPGRLACGAALLLTSAETPMLFMGEEWGASTPWQYFTDHTDDSIGEAVRRGRRDEFESHGWARADIPDPQRQQTFARSKLDWTETEHEPHASLLAWYTTLIRARREHPDLGDPRLDRVRVVHDAEAQTVVVHRAAYVVAVNLADHARRIAIDVQVDAPGDAPGELGIVVAWRPDKTTLAEDVLTLPPESAAVLGPAPS
jgi:maltooligosyltrehalose trehalohydrolase